MLNKLLFFKDQKDRLSKRYAGEEFMDPNDLLDELTYRIMAGSFIFIEGKVGKTFLLYKLIQRFKGHRKVVYLDCRNLEEKLNIENLLLERYGFFTKVLGIMPKRMIILLDNIDSLSKRNSERIKYLFDHDFIKSVVFTAKKAEGVDFNRSIVHRIANRTYSAPRINVRDLIAISKDLTNQAMLHKRFFVIKLFRKSGHSIAKFKKSLRILDDHIGHRTDNSKVTYDELYEVI